MHKKSYGNGDGDGDGDGDSVDDGVGDSIDNDGDGDGDGDGDSIVIRKLSRIDWPKPNKTEKAGTRLGWCFALAQPLN